MRRFPKRTRTPASPGCERQLVDGDGYFVAELIYGRQWQRVAAPEAARVKPIRILVGDEQAHLLVRDGDGLGTVRGFQTHLALLCLPSLRRLLDPLVEERYSACPVTCRRHPATKPSASHAGGARKRRAVHSCDDP